MGKLLGGPGSSFPKLRLGLNTFCPRCGCDGCRDTPLPGVILDWSHRPASSLPLREVPRRTEHEAEFLNLKIRPESDSPSNADKEVMSVPSIGLGLCVGGT